MICFSLVLLVVSGFLLGMDGGSLDLIWSEAAYNWLSHPENDAYIRFFKWMSSPWGGQFPNILLISASVTVFLYAYVARRRGKSDPRLAMLFHHAGLIVLAAVAIGVSSRLLKGVVARERPSYAKGNLKYTAWNDITSRKQEDPWNQGSFPSGHTTQAAVVFGALYWLRAAKWPHWKVQAVKGIGSLLFAAYVCLMGMSRIALAKHWVSDVVFGGILGFFCVVLAARIMLGSGGGIPRLACRCCAAPSSDDEKRLAQDATTR